MALTASEGSRGPSTHQKQADRRRKEHFMEYARIGRVFISVGEFRRRGRFQSSPSSLHCLGGQTRSNEERTQSNEKMMDETRIAAGRPGRIGRRNAQ